MKPEQPNNKLLQKLGDAIGKLAKECFGLPARQWWSLASQVPLLCERILELGKPVRWGKRDVTVAEAKELVAMAEMLGAWVELDYEVKANYIPFDALPVVFQHRANFEQEYIKSWPAEQQWLYERQAFSHLSIHFLRVHKTHASDQRKQRLLACALVRRVEALLPKEARREAIAVAEQLADGLVARDQLTVARRRCGKFKGTAIQQYAAVNAVLAVLDSAAMKTFVAAGHWAAVAGGAKEGTPYSDEAVVPSSETENAAQIRLLRDVFGNPYRAVKFAANWLTPAVVGLARSIYRERTFDLMPILSDALETAGCADPEILEHCRQPGQHVRGCWVVDLILGSGQIPAKIPAEMLADDTAAQAAPPQDQALTKILAALHEADLGRDWADGPMQVVVKVLHPNIEPAENAHDARQLQIVSLLGWPRLLCYAIAGANAGLETVADRRVLAVELFKAIPLDKPKKKISLDQVRCVAARAALGVHPLGCDGSCPLHLAVQAMVAGGDTAAAQAQIAHCTHGGAMAAQSIRASSEPAHCVVVAYRHLVAAYADRSPTATAPNAAREAARTEAKVNGARGALEICLEIARGLGLM